MTSVITPDHCIGSDYPDYDQDGLGDRCEWDLAAAFAPLMNYWKFDDIGHEGYWAARPYNGSVLLQYQMGYYLDLGVAENYTECRLTFGVAECDGHSGDSESITLVVSYEADTHHWLLTEARLSAHEEYIVLTGEPYVASLGYSNKVGGDPVIWVSNKKHANYPSQSTVRMEV
jgi:hypothetical protein